VILGDSTVAESTCPATGERIRIGLTPDAVVSVTPKDAVVSQRHHDEVLADVRAQVCDHGHFFSSPVAAETWAAEHPAGEVVSVAEAFDHGRAECAKLGWIGKVKSR
jgi:alkylmercury lyase